MAWESWIFHKYEGAEDLESFPEISSFGHFRREKNYRFKKFLSVWNTIGHGQIGSKEKKILHLKPGV